MNANMLIRMTGVTQGVEQWKLGGSIHIRGLGSVVFCMLLNWGPDENQSDAYE